MIVYNSTKEKFLLSVSDDSIEDIIRAKVLTKLNRRTGESEYNSWRNSMQFMYHVLNSDEIPFDAGVAIEYTLPQSSKRIDFIVTGQNDKKEDFMVIVELKQWSEINITDKDGVVSTRFGARLSDEPHPSYQAWSYCSFLEGFNEAVYTDGINLKPCAYLHNHINNNTVTNDFYAHYIEKAPVFCKGDKEKLQHFIKRYVKFGDRSKILYRIDNGKIRPSKNLADSIVSMLKKNQEFVLIDEQKVVHENAMVLAKKSSDIRKNVLIVEGGPGTGKSVVAINLLVELTKLGLLAQYVSKNAAPRAVYQNKLRGNFTQNEISNLFKGSGAFVECEKNLFDALIVDEAHRLNEQSGLYGNLGENQIKEIINASKFSVFFIDEDQRVTLKDIGSKQEIEKWAKKLGANITTLELPSQFRCNGSDGYLAWLDQALQIKDSANITLEDIDYDFKIFSSLTELREAIIAKNKINNKARLVAGYCWNWISKNDHRLYDLYFPGENFQMKWNLTQDGSLWIISPDSINEVGCIHTCQGLELDYVGVIVGPDFIVRNDKVIVDPSKRASSDMSIKGWKNLMKRDPIETTQRLDSIIKNTYRTLMTRGMKGCYVYFIDKEVEEYFRSRIDNLYNFDTSINIAAEPEPDFE